MSKLVTAAGLSLLIVFSAAFFWGGTPEAFAYGDASIQSLPTSTDVGIPGWAQRPVVVTEENKADARRFHSEGNSFYSQKEFEKSIESLTRSVQLNPYESDVWYDLAMAFSKKAEFQKAEDSLMQAIQLNPDFEKAYVQMSIVLCQQGKCGGGGGAATR